MDKGREYPKVLLVSDATWSDTNNIGNTFSNLFGGWDPEKLAMVYARADMPENGVCRRYFQIAENRMIKRMFDKSVKTGVEISEGMKTSAGLKMKEDEETGRKLYSFFKRFRWNIFLLARNMLWKFGNWRTPELDEFVDSFDADAVFLLACEGSYMNDLQQHIVRRAGRKAAIYFVDDIYSARQFSLSPFFWLQKLISRGAIRDTVKLCEKVYTIVSDQKEEYDAYFGRESEVINKGGSFEGEAPEPPAAEYPLKFVFTGNVIAGRWKTLAAIGKSLDRLNGNENLAELHIYTRNELLGKMEKAFGECRSINFKGPIPASEVKPVQRGADVLVHVESFNLKERLLTRLSFSTKLVDYFERGRCILAIGWKDAASVRYLAKNDAAVVVDDLEKLDEELRELISDPDLVKSYGSRGWKLGKESHRLEMIRDKLYREICDMESR